MIFGNEKEVLSYYKKDPENNQVIIYKGIVYDIKDYMDKHPGGSKIIKPSLGKNIEEPFEDQEHSKSALKDLLELPKFGKIIKNIDIISAP